MDDINKSILRYLTEMTSEMKKIKQDISDINNDIKKIKEEQSKILDTFPNGLESHKKDHAKKKWVIF